MSTPAPLYGCPVDPTTAQFHTDTPLQAGVPQAEAANDSAEPGRDPDFYRNPLWLIAIAGGLLFSAMAALLALG